MNGNKQCTLELLWRIFIVCYLSKQLSPIEKLNQEISILKTNLSKYASCSIEEQLITIDIVPLQKQHINLTSTIHLLIKWVQLICAHYKFWLYDLQESFADGRALLYIISYYLPSLCDYKRDIKHLTTLATCQTRNEHIKFNVELGQQQLINIYERNVKSNFRLLEECIKLFGTFSSDFIKYEYYAKDVPDERCTIIILAMLAHDLIFSNNNNNENDFRHQKLFKELKEKYFNDNESIIDIKNKENSINSSEISISTNTFVKEKLIFEEEEEDKENITNLPSRALSQSIFNTMNYDILDRIELLSELDHSDDDDDDEDDEDSFSSITRIDHQRILFAATISLNDFIELEKTIENEENKNPTNSTSLFLIDETISSDIDGIELNKLDEIPLVDPVNRKMIKEIFMTFLSHQQQTFKNEESMGYNSQSIRQISHEKQSETQREVHAAQVFQAHWRGRQVRVDNKRDNHPVVAIVEKFRSYDSKNNSSLTLRKRMIQIVHEYYELSTSSLTVYLHFIRDIESIINSCIEIRYLIAQQGLLRLFFLLMRCCNRSESLTVSLGKVLNILQLFTVKHNLIMKLIDRSEQIKDFIMLLLKNYQKNDCELFEQICFLLQTIVNDEQARQILRSNKSFTETIEYVYKRLFNKISVKDNKYRQQVRSTPKPSHELIKRRVTVLNQSSIVYPTPKIMHRSIDIQNENILKQNLISIEQFMKVFYRH